MPICLALEADIGKRSTKNGDAKDGSVLSQRSSLSLEAAIMYDTLLVLAEAVRNLDLDGVLRPTNVSCESEKAWEQGATFFNYINAVETRGVTGQIRFQVSTAS